MSNPYWFDPELTQKYANEFTTDQIIDVLYDLIYSIDWMESHSDSWLSRIVDKEHYHQYELLSHHQKDALLDSLISEFLELKSKRFSTWLQSWESDYIHKLEIVQDVLASHHITSKIRPRIFPFMDRIPVSLQTPLLNIENAPHFKWFRIRSVRFSPESHDNLFVLRIIWTSPIFKQENNWKMDFTNHPEKSELEYIQWFETIFQDHHQRKHEIDASVWGEFEKELNLILKILKQVDQTFGRGWEMRKGNYFKA